MSQITGDGAYQTRPDRSPLEEKGDLLGSAHVENDPQSVPGLQVTKLVDQPDE